MKSNNADFEYGTCKHGRVVKTLVSITNYLELYIFSLGRKIMN